MATAISMLSSKRRGDQLYLSIEVTISSESRTAPLTSSSITPEQSSKKSCINTIEGGCGIAFSQTLLEVDDYLSPKSPAAQLASAGAPEQASKNSKRSYINSSEGGGGAAHAFSQTLLDDDDYLALKSPVDDTGNAEYDDDETQDEDNQDGQLFDFEEERVVKKAKTETEEEKLPKVEKGRVKKALSNSMRVATSSVKRVYGVESGESTYAVTFAADDNSTTITCECDDFKNRGSSFYCKHCMYIMSSVFGIDLQKTGNTDPKVLLSLIRHAIFGTKE